MNIQPNIGSFVDVISVIKCIQYSNSLAVVERIDNSKCILPRALTLVLINLVG